MRLAKLGAVVSPSPRVRWSDDTTALSWAPRMRRLPLAGSSTSASFCGSARRRYASHANGRPVSERVVAYHRPGKLRTAHGRVCGLPFDHLLPAGGVPMSRNYRCCDSRVDDLGKMAAKLWITASAGRSPRTNRSVLAGCVSLVDTRRLGHLAVCCTRNHRVLADCYARAFRARSA